MLLFTRDVLINISRILEVGHQLVQGKGLDMGLDPGTG